MSQLTFAQVAQYAYNAGFRGAGTLQNPGPLTIATAITQPESSRNAAAVQQGQPAADTGYGLWQITPGSQADLDPQTNANAAYAKFQGAGGFGPWTTYPRVLSDQGTMQQALTAAQSISGATSGPPSYLGGFTLPGLPSASAPAQGVASAITGAVGKGFGGVKIGGQEIGWLNETGAGMMVMLAGLGLLGWVLLHDTDVGRGTLRVARDGFHATRDLVETGLMVAK